MSRLEKFLIFIIIMGFVAVIGTLIYLLPQANKEEAERNAFKAFEKCMILYDDRAKCLKDYENAIMVK